MYRILILLIRLGGIVQGDVRIDMGDIPYENQDRESAVVGATTDRDYGEIPYDKGIEKHRDYGNIPYERVFSKPHIEDYGNVPYEKDLDIPAGGNDEFDIKGKIMEILGGREIPGLIKTTRYSDDHWATRPSRSTLLTKPSLSAGLSTIRMRAETNTDAATMEYESPQTIDDSYCSDTPNFNCSRCTDKEGYRRYCLNGTTTAAPSDINLLIRILVNLTSDYEDYETPKKLDTAGFNRSIFNKYPKGWPNCATTPSTTAAPTPTEYAPNERNGRTISKCYVCGLTADDIPDGTENTLCADSFMSHAFKKHCKFVDRAGWFYNGTQDFYMWGRFTGGCSMRFVDIAPIYTQRTCRDRQAPTVGASYVSRRLAKLEYALKNDSDNCISTPEASLVPLSRGISLYSRMTVCVCSKDYCNRAVRMRSEAVSIWHAMIAAGVLGISKAF